MSDPWSSAPSCVSSLVQLCAQNCDHLPPPPHPYISETAFSHRFQKAYTPPPYGTKFWCIGPKLEKTPKNCEFAPCWHKPDVPERYGRRPLALMRVVSRGAKGQRGGVFGLLLFVVLSSLLNSGQFDYT